MAHLNKLAPSVQRVVSPAFMQGTEDVDFAEYVRPFPGKHEIPQDSVRLLLDEAMRTAKKAGLSRFDHRDMASLIRRLMSR